MPNAGRHLDSTAMFDRRTIAAHRSRMLRMTTAGNLEPEAVLCCVLHTAHAAAAIDEMLTLVGAPRFQPPPAGERRIGSAP